MGLAVKSLMAQGTEQIGPREPGQESSGHGGCSDVCSVDVPAVARSAPPEVVSSSGSAPVGGLEDCNLILLVEDRVETHPLRMWGYAQGSSQGLMGDGIPISGNRRLCSSEYDEYDQAWYENCKNVPRRVKKSK